MTQTAHEHFEEVQKRIATEGPHLIRVASMGVEDTPRQAQPTTSDDKTTWKLYAQLLAEQRAKQEAARPVQGLPPEGEGSPGILDRLLALEDRVARALKREGPEAQTARFRTAMKPEVGAVLQRACKDCHSNETTWPWYSRIAPVSWIVAKDVNKGREKLNFSEWSSRKPSANEVEEICDAVMNGSMPPGKYLLLHPEATLWKPNVDVICDWADTARKVANKGGRTHP